MAYDPEEERDGRGRWTTAYHGTQVPEDFRAFSDHRFGRSDEKSLGFHFASTPEGANDRLRNLNPKKYAPGNTDEFGTNARIIPVKIQGHNFIHVDDQTDWRDLFRVLRDEKGFNLRGPKEGAITREYLNRVLTRLGYHGVSYTNRVEAPGQTSFLVLNTKRIKMMKSLRPETIEYLKGIGLTTHAGRGRRKNRPMGRARIFLKDMDVGDVHLPANIGGDAPRRRPRKCPALSLARPEPNMTPAQAYVQKHFFSAKRRRKLAATGAAMPGGSFPIEAPKDVHNAMELLHHHDTPAVRAHIKSRAQALGMGDPFQKDWTQFDQERGAGEKTGRVAGLGTGLYATPRVARIVSRVMISRGFKRFPALGAGAIAAYGTVRGAQAAGGYVGRKIDELGAKVFKAGGTDEARDEAGRWTATQHHLDQANHHAKMARAYISAAPNLSGKKLSDAVDAADMHTTAAAFHAGEAERLHAMAPKMGHLASIVARVARSIRKDWTKWNEEHQKELEQHHADYASGKISMNEANRRIGRLAARANQVSIHEVSAKEPAPRRSPLMARAGRGAVAGAKVGAVAGGLFHGAGAGMAAGPKGALVGGALGAVHGAVAGSLIGTLGGALFGKGSVEQTMHEFKQGKLHSGSKKGPTVTDRAQAIAIALNQAGKSNA